MKQIIIIAGPNGAGKTSFAEEFLPHEAGCSEFVNADLIAAGLSPFHPERVAVTAGRLMLKRLGELVSVGESFALETTLASRMYLRLIPRWQKLGYRVVLVFLKLPHAEMSKQRVEQRVHLGGHNIPPHTIRRRFERGLKYLREDYLASVDEWAIYDGSKNPPTLMEKGSRDNHTKVEEAQAVYASNGVGEVCGDDFWKGAEAALKRASEKAVARARAQGLEPVVANPEKLAKES